MHQVYLTGWKPGLQKVSLDKLIKARAVLPLSAAFQTVNRLLNGEKIVLAFETDEEARRFVLEARGLGAEAELGNPRPPASFSLK